MDIDKPDRHGTEQEFVHPNPVMDAALEWFAMLQGYPDDHGLRAEFEAWRRSDPANDRAFTQIAGVWSAPELDVVAARLAQRIAPLADAAAAADADIVVPIGRGRRRRLRQAMIGMAAALLLAVGVQQYPAMMLAWRADHQTATGAREEIILPDGSRMTLNTASAVSIDFAGGRRSVALLRGEAYFDVVHDASRPFTVAAAFSTVEVKGTAFAVRTDAGQDMVMLERGSVEVSSHAVQGGKATLQPGQAVTATAQALSAVRAADPATALSWRDGRLVFENQPFEQVLAEIGRYYDHTILVASDRVGQSRVTGNYRLDNPERTIRSLAATVGGDVTRIPGGILILR